MRFDPKAILVSLAAGGFILYAAERPEPVVIPVVRPTVTAGLPHTTANQLRVSVKPSTEEPSDLWSLKPLVRPPIPAAPPNSTNPIDAFVQSLYAAKKVTSVGPADKRTLLRRIYFDLIGIPPSPAEQEEYLNDKSPDAYEKLIDRLLASEQYGVRYGRHWLDVLRYATPKNRCTPHPEFTFGVTG